MADDGKIVIGIEGNPSGLNKALDDVEKKGQKTAQSVGSAFSAIGGALAGAGIIASFKGAFDAANRLEASLARVTSSAKAFGLSTESAKKAAIDLAKDGFLSLNQSASALSNLMSTGLNIDQSKKFIEASKNIAAFGNTVGSASDSIESGIKGIITGSSELVENMSPAMKKLSMAFTENKTKVGEAKAVQELYNGVIKLGNQYAGDAAKYLDTAAAAQNKFNAAAEAASAAIGKSLQPALKGVFQILSGLVESFTKWFSGLSSSSQTLVSVGVAISALLPVLGALLPLLKAISLSNPFGWAAAAVLAITSLIVALKELTELNSGKLVDSYKESQTALKELGAQADALSKINKRTAEQDRELISTKEELKKKAKELGVDYDKLAKSAKNAGDMAERLTNIEREQKATILRNRLAEVQAGRQSSAAMQGKMREQVGGGLLSSASGVDTANLLFSNEEKQLIKDIERLYQPDAAGTGPKASSQSGKRPEQRFLETQQKLKEIELNRLSTIAAAENVKDVDERKRRQDRAYQDAEILAKTEVNALRSAYAEYIEDKAMADKIALDEQTDAAIRAIRQQEEAGELIKEQAEAKIQKVREANARKAAQIGAQSVVNTLTAANNIVSAMRQGPAGAGGILSGAGELGGALQNMGIMARGGTSAKLLETAGLVGPFVGIATTLMSGISGLFGKSDDERAKEANEQKQRDEEAKALLELQANYQKSMLALQEAAAKLPFENLARQLRLVDIESQKQILAGGDIDAINKQRLSGRLSAMQGVLSSQGGAIGGGQLFGNVGSTPDELIKFLSDSAALKNKLGPLFTLAGSSGSVSLSQMTDMLVTELTRLGYTGINRTETGMTYGQFDSGGGQNTDQDKLVYAAMRQAIAGQYGHTPLTSLMSEFGVDTGIAENLLSVIEQSLQTEQEIAGHTKKTADNTSRLTNMKESNLLDLAGGGIRGFGSFFRGAFNSVDSLINPKMPGLSTPSAISNSLSVASLTRSWQDRAADGIENLVKIQTEALRLLAEIALNTDAQGQVQGSMTSAQLQDIMANIRSRIV